MAALNFHFHAAQQEVWNDPARFKVVVAGRRSGKTHYAAINLILEGLKNVSPRGFDMIDSHVYYIATTLPAARKNIWKKLKRLARPILSNPTRDIKEKDMTIVLPNGRHIMCLGADDPEALRGPSLSYAVLDEYADMHPDTWETVISPALSDMDGSALFIGTPKGKNHFYNLYHYALKSGDPEWAAFTFSSASNPMISEKELKSAKNRMSREAYEQEYNASFRTKASKFFDAADFRELSELEYRTLNPQGNVYITVDPNGFKDVNGLSKSQLEALDQTAIAVVMVSAAGWYVLDMIHGRWGVRETSLQIIRAAQKWRPAALGIEKGSLKSAIMPYLEDQMRRLNIYPNIAELTHGGQRKVDRVIWALQGRFQNHRIHFVRNYKGEGWIEFLSDQLMDFPDPLSHDDGPDALAYIDQIAQTVYNEEYYDQDDYEYEPLDEVAGY